MHDARMLLQMREKSLVVRGEMDCFAEWAEDCDDNRRVESEPVAQYVNALGSLLKEPRAIAVDGFEQQPIGRIFDGIFRKRIGNIRHHFHNVEVELLVEEAEGCVGECSPRPRRPKVMPKANWNA